MVEQLHTFTFVIVYHEGQPTKSQEYTIKQTKDHAIHNGRMVIENNKAVHTLQIFIDDVPKPILEYHRAFGELQNGY